jgi:CheY-like chemotaxis protein
MSQPIDVLLIDDDKDIRETVATILEEEGFNVATAVHGEEAFARLREDSPPRLILLDLVMPVMDGELFLSRLHDIPRLASVPVVIISGSGNVEKAAASLKVAGALPKPIELEQLLGTVARCISR